MSSRVRLFLGAFVLLVLATVSANATVIDFEVLENPSYIEVDQGFRYEEDGYVLENLGSLGPYQYEFASYGTNATWYTGSTSLFNNTDNGVTRLTRLNGGAFDLISIDLARLSGVLAESRNVSVTFIADNGHAQTFTNLANDGSPTTYFFDSGFAGISSVTWKQEIWYHQFDNISVSAVPIPAAVWLFGAGLAFLGLIRRKPVP